MVDTGGVTVTLKGTDGSYSLAVWQNDGYSYAIGLTDGISEEEMTALIESCS